MLRKLKLVDTAAADASSSSTASRLWWMVLIWCASVGGLTLVGLALRLLLKP